MRAKIEKWYLPVGLMAVAWFKWPGAWLAFSQGKWLAVHWIALVVAALAIVRGPKLPRLNTKEAIFFLTVIAGSIAQIFYFSPRGFYFPFLDRISFLLLVLGAWHAFRKPLSWPDFWTPLAVVITVVSGIGLWQMWKIGFPGEMPYLVVGSTFGHANNCAQALGLLLLLWWGIRRPAGPWWIMPLVSGLALTYFFFLRGRSTLIGLALALAVLGYLRFRREGKSFFRQRALWVATGLAVLCFGGFQLAKGKAVEDLLQFRIFTEKSSMTLWREDIWRQTVAMIRENPLGVGPDNFTFSFIPYHARGITLTESVADTPHNEILRYFAEDGIPLTILYALLLAYLFRRWWRTGRDRIFVLPIVVFLGVEALTQFPFNNPMPAYAAALLLGFMAGQIWPEEMAWKRPKLAQGLVIALGLFQLFITVRVAIARSFEHSPSEDLSKLSCRMVPLNWHSCLGIVLRRIERGELNGAREEAEDILFNDPWNFTAMRYLSLIAFRQGDRLEACYYLWKYDHLFYDRSSIHDKVALNCSPKWLDYFRRKAPEAYMPRYNAYMAKRSREPWIKFRFWE